jgi:hypothetical protein
MRLFLFYSIHAIRFFFWSKTFSAAKKVRPARAQQEQARGRG